MKRSFIDARIDAMVAMCARFGVALPPFALWREQDYRADPDAARRIAQAGLGWSVNEFKRGGFATDGLTVFTLRMGDWRRLDHGRGRLYAEKALMAENGQRTPRHYHIVKTEDVINRGGARFVVELFKVDRAGAPLKERFHVLKDVKTLDLAAGDRVALEPGEVSLANDDASDNYFLPPPDSPAPIEEDAPKRYVTARDHARLVGRVG